MRVSKAIAALSLTLLAFTGHASTQSPAPPTGSFVAGDVLVKFRPGASAGVKADAHALAGGTPLNEITRTGVQRVSVPAGAESAAIARYQRNPNVLYAEPNYIRSIPEPVSHGPASLVVPSDYYFDEEYGLHNIGQTFQCLAWWGGELCFYIGTPDADIDAPEAWAISTGSADVRVAVIDTGIDYNHPDLAANYAGGDDFIFEDGDPWDDQGHGTHVAGTIAAAMNNLTGSPGKEEGVVGVAPNARILAYKVCRADGSCDDFAIQRAIAQAIIDGAKVINMSLGGPDFSQSMYDGVQDAWNAGLVIVAGAGNYDPNDPTADPTSAFYPAAFDNVISVAAFDEDHRRAAFSKYGNWVHISAPGNVIMSTYPMVNCAGAATVPGDTGCYTWLSGTSMATPHVSGAAALVWSRNDVTANSQVVDILLQSADPRGVATMRLDTWTIHGGLNVHDALSHGWTNQPPVANAGADQTVIDSDRDGVQDVALDAGASFDPDGSVVSYEWREGDTIVGVGVAPTVWLSIGSHTLTLLVTDDSGGTGTDTVLVTVEPPGSPADTVVITKASYNTRRRQLTVEATSSGAPAVILTAFDASNPSSPVELGPLSYNSRKAKYAATFDSPSRPGSVLVTSSGGGSDTSSVSGK